MGKNVLLRSLLVLLIGIFSVLPMTVHAAEYGTQAVNKLTISRGTNDTATLAVTVNDGTINVTVPVQLDVAVQNTAEAVAQKIADTLNTQISGAYTVSASGRDVLLTAKTAAENKNVSISTAEVVSGVTPVDATPGDEYEYINPGVAPKEATKAHHVFQWHGYTNDTKENPYYLEIALGSTGGAITFKTPPGPCSSADIVNMIKSQFDSAVSGAAFNIKQKWDVSFDSSTITFDAKEAGKQYAQYVTDFPTDDTRYGEPYSVGYGDYDGSNWEDGIKEQIDLSINIPGSAVAIASEYVKVRIRDDEKVINAVMYAAVSAGDSFTVIAGKVAAAINADSSVSAVYEASSSSSTVSLKAKEAEANRVITFYIDEPETNLKGLTGTLVTAGVEPVVGEVNAAVSATAMRTVLEANASGLGIDVTTATDGYYGYLLSGGKDAVAAAVLNGKGGGYATASQVRNAFNNAVTSQSGAENAVRAVNDAADAAALQGALVNNCVSIGIGGSVNGTAAAYEYADLSTAGKAAVAEAVFTARPESGYLTAADIKSVFDSTVKERYALEAVNNADSGTAMRAVLEDTNLSVPFADMQALIGQAPYSGFDAASKNDTGAVVIQGRPGEGFTKISDITGVFGDAVTVVAEREKYEKTCTISGTAAAGALTGENAAVRLKADKSADGSITVAPGSIDGFDGYLEFGAGTAVNLTAQNWTGAAKSGSAAVTFTHNGLSATLNVSVTLQPTADSVVVKNINDASDAAAIRSILDTAQNLADLGIEAADRDEYAGYNDTARLDIAEAVYQSGTVYALSPEGAAAAADALRNALTGAGQRETARTDVNKAGTAEEMKTALLAHAGTIGIDVTKDEQGYYAHLSEAGKNVVVTAVLNGKDGGYDSVDVVKVAFNNAVADQAALEKAFGDVNGAADGTAMKEALESNRTTIGITDSINGTAASYEYADLTTDGKSKAASAVLKARPGSGYTSTTAIKADFDSAVKNQAALEAVNNAKDGAAVRAALEDSALADVFAGIQTKISQVPYSEFASTIKDDVGAAVRSGKPAETGYTAITGIADAFDAAVAVTAEKEKYEEACNIESATETGALTGGNAVVRLKAGKTADNTVTIAVGSITGFDGYLETGESTAVNLTKKNWTGAAMIGSTALTFTKEGITASLNISITLQPVAGSVVIKSINNATSAAIVKNILDTEQNLKDLGMEDTDISKYQALIDIKKLDTGSIIYNKGTDYALSPEGAQAVEDKFRYGVNNADDRYLALSMVNDAMTTDETRGVLYFKANIIGIDLTTNAQGYFAHLSEEDRNEVVTAVYEEKTSTGFYKSVDDIKTVFDDAVAARASQEKGFDEVNGAADAEAMKTALESNCLMIGIADSVNGTAANYEYADLTEGGRLNVAAAVLGARPASGGYTTAEKIKADFDSAVKNQAALEAVNNAANGAAVKDALEDAAFEDLFKEIQTIKGQASYSGFDTAAKTDVDNAVFGGKPAGTGYAGLQDITNAFDTAVTVVAEKSKYEKTCTISGTTAAGTLSGANSVVRLESGEAANSTVTVSCASITGFTGYLETAGGTAVNLTAQNWTGADITGSAEVTFAKNGIPSTLSVSITLEPTAGSTVVKGINDADDASAVKSILDVEQNLTNLGITSGAKADYAGLDDDSKKETAVGVYNGGTDYALTAAGAQAVATAFENATGLVKNQATAIAAVNNATTTEGMQSAILNNYTTLMISQTALNDYNNTLTDARKNNVLQSMLDGKGSGYSDAGAIRDRFEAQVLQQKNEQEKATVDEVITAAKALLPNSIAPVEGENTNILVMLNAIQGMAAKGVTLAVESSDNPQIAQTGDITYAAATAGDVTVSVSKTNGTTQNKAISVSVPAKDNTDPVPGDSGSITVSAIGSSGLTLSWTAAADAVTTDSSKLKYYIYKSTTDNLSSDIKPKGSLLNIDGTAKTTYDVTGLSASTQYYFNIVVRDLAGNKASYTAVNATTAAVHVDNPGSPDKTPGSTPPPASVTKTVSDRTTRISAEVTAAADSTGKVSAAVSDAQIADILNYINTSTSENTVVEIKAALSGTAAASEVKLPAATALQIADSKAGAVTIDTGLSTITLDKNTLDTIAQSLGNAGTAAQVSVSVAKVDTQSVIAGYSEESRASIAEMIGDRPIYNFSIKAGDQSISDFGEGTVSVAIPYTPRDGEDLNDIVVYYVNDAGELKAVPNCKYDPATKTVGFTASHFSKYAVGYNKVIFKDVPDQAWYYKALDYVAARGVINGTKGGNFAPRKAITRADFLIMVMRAYDIAPEENVSDNFADAGTNKYYTKYLGTAKSLGLASGTGNNRYAPEAAISREDMLTLLYRVLDKLDSLPAGNSGKSIERFSDSSQVAAYAEAAVKYFVEAGIIEGSGGKLSPRSTTERAQVVQILYKLLSR